MGNPAKNFRAQIAKTAEHANRTLGAGDLDLLVKFVELVDLWNQKLDLTAAKTDQALAEVLLLDSMFLADEGLVARGARVLDVGSGAGAPALGLALLRPDLTFTLVEPLTKRVAFLRTAIGALGLSQRVTVVPSRFDGASDGVHNHDVAMSRATFSPEEWLQVASPVVPRVLVLTAASEPPPAPTNWRQATTLTYETRSGSKRCITAYEPVR